MDIKLYENVTIQKVSDHGGAEKTPTHKIVVSDSSYQNKQFVASLWTRDSTRGKFLSGTMDKPYSREKDGITIKSEGFYIVQRDEITQLLSQNFAMRARLKELGEKFPDENKVPEVTDEELNNPDDIPF